MPRKVTVIATAVLILLAGACGGSGSPTGSPGPAAASTSPSAIAYSACMRANGVPRFPDPDSSGSLPKADPGRLGVSSSQLHAARQTCQSLLPAGGRATNAASIQECFMAADCPRVLVQQVLTEERRFAECMRSTGLPNWPDPITDSQGRPVFVISISNDGFNPYSPSIWAKGNRCSRTMPNLPAAPFQVSP